MEETTTTAAAEESTNNNNNNLTQSIKEEQQQQVSYILEASQADDLRSKYLAKKNEYKIMFDDGHEETFKRLPLSSRKNKEIDDLRTAFTSNRFEMNSSSNKKIKVLGKEYDNLNDILYEAFKRTAQYCLGMTSAQYDSAIWEDDPEYVERDIYGLRSIVGACLLRAVHGIAYFRQP